MDERVELAAAGMYEADYGAWVASGFDPAKKPPGRRDPKEAMAELVKETERLGLYEAERHTPPEDAVDEYGDEHVVEFSHDAYGLQHPVACRPALLSCPVHLALAGLAAPDREPGRYAVALVDGELVYDALARTEGSGT